MILIRKSLEDLILHALKMFSLVHRIQNFLFSFFCSRAGTFFSFNGNERSKSGNKNSSKISLSRVTIERIPLSILFTLSIILKVAERLVRAGADVRRCKNAKRFKTNSEVFDATDIKQTQTQKVYKIYQIPP